MFKDGKDFEIIRQGLDVVIKINYLGRTQFPNIEDSKEVMSDVVRRLASNKNVTKVVLVHNKNYEYQFEQVSLLREVAQAFFKLGKQKTLFTKPSAMSVGNQKTVKVFFQRYSFLQNLILKELPGDPIGAYVSLKRKHRELKFESKYDQTVDPEQEKHYLYALEVVMKEFEGLSIIKKVKDNLSGFSIGDRSLYKQFFSPNIKPNFVFTTLLKKFPVEAKLLDSYKVDDAQVNIFELDNEAYNLYHVVPAEFSLSEEEYNVLNLAKEVILEHQPNSNDFIDVKRLREVFANIARDLIEEIAEFKGIKFTLDQTKKLTNILIRNTIGFGIIEVLLGDENVQDISVNSPPNRTAIFLTHGQFEDCKTNIIPEQDEVEGWASRLRMISGRPLDGSNPILDTEIETPKARARVSAITRPLNPFGYGFSFRRHRNKPWTLPLFVKNGMLSAQAAGLISFLVDGARTMLIAGTRGSGKSSFLTAVMIEIMRKYRIITIEDTMEMPVIAFNELGFNIQPMSVKSALSVSKEGFSASDGIRSTLRLGDSALIVGEVRSTEVVALYEAMRVGALANVVAGTIHGDSPYGVYDRIVNDLGVNKTSFKATDIVFVVNPVRSSDGLHRMRRVVRITEVRKGWEDDPVIEGGFTDLMVYDPETDKLEVTQELENGNSDILKAIGASVPQWVGNWDAIWDNVVLRGKIKQFMVDHALEVKNDLILEAPSVISANDMYHKIAQRVSDERGYLDSEQIFFEWKEWFVDFARKVEEE